MPVPVHVFDPPFNILRCSHAVLDVTNLDASRKFYESIIGLHVEDADDKAVFLRGSEEHQHHSLVLRKAPTPACNRLGFRVANESDLDKVWAHVHQPPPDLRELRPDLPAELSRVLLRGMAKDPGARPSTAGQFARAARAAASA